MNPPQSSVCLQFSALFSSTTPTATVEITAPMNEVPLPFPSPFPFPWPFTPPLTLFLAFLSYLRLSIYMSVVAIAIVVSFHLKSQPSPLELHMARPLGIIFWFLSLCCLALGFGNYIKTVEKYSRRMAIVQTGWKTQSVSYLLLFSAFGGFEMGDEWEEEGLERGIEMRTGAEDVFEGRKEGRREGMRVGGTYMRRGETWG